MIKMIKDRHPYVAGDLLVATNVRVKELVGYGAAELIGDTPPAPAAKKASRSAS